MPAVLKWILFAAALVLSGCASVDPRDPLEPLNREIYAFNDDVDRKIARPVAEAYQAYVPQPIRTGVSNFFSNLGDVLVLANDILQFKLEQSVSDFMRLTVNTVFGFAGLIDIATPMGLPKHNEDFGQTLAVWGVGSGPYIVLPLLGPSTLRDSTGMVADWQGDPVAGIDDEGTEYGMLTLRVVDTRAELLQASRILDQAALDPYTFMRDAYLQRRRSLIYDGAPPPERLDDGGFDDFEEFELDPEPPPDAPR